MNRDSRPTIPERRSSQSRVPPPFVKIQHYDVAPVTRRELYFISIAALVVGAFLGGVFTTYFLK